MSSTGPLRSSGPLSDDVWLLPLFVSTVSRHHDNVVRSIFKTDLNNSTLKDQVFSPAQDEMSCAIAQFRGCVKDLCNNAILNIYLLCCPFAVLCPETSTHVQVMLPASSIPVGVHTVSPHTVTFWCSYALNAVVNVAFAVAVAVAVTIVVTFAAWLSPSMWLSM